MERSFLQSNEWAKFKERFGWKHIQLGQLSILERVVALGKRVAYAPEVLWEDFDAEQFQAYGAELGKRGGVFAKVEFLDAPQQLPAYLRPSKSAIQPMYRAWVDLTKPLDAIFNQMSEKTRYNIRLAQKKGVVVEEEEELGDETYALFAGASKRAKITTRLQTYLQALVNLGSGHLFVARYQNKPAAAAIVIFYERWALYLYGGSNYALREAMAPHVLHARVIAIVKARGATVYDLGGMPSPDASPTHSWAGLGRFKASFGGRPVELGGSYDMVLAPLWYKIYNVADRLRGHGGD